NSILLVLLGVAAGVVLTVGVPKLLARAKRMGAVRFVGVTSVEEEVIEIIRSKGGSCSQKSLYTGLNLSQAKVSIMLNNLEERGVVRRFREGRENMIYLIEKP
ncbi:MAG: winged helix-turn-helix transcriptional regulator, partial [Candidatus Thorarchaeota archaeon]